MVALDEPLLEQVLRQVVRLDVLLDVRPVVWVFAAGDDLQDRDEVGEVQLHQGSPTGGALFRVCETEKERDIFQTIDGFAVDVFII